MKFKKAILATSLGIAMTGAPLVASAFSLGGFTGPIELQWNGFTTSTGAGETAAYGDETTFGGGYITGIFEFGNPNNVLWSPVSSGETLSYFLYGQADGNIIQGPDGGRFDLYNTGCTGGADCDGGIHIDFYLNSTGGSFTDTTAGIQATERTAFDQLTSLTDGTLLWAWEMVAGIQGVDMPDGIDSNSSYDERQALMKQEVDSVTLPATGDGDFYADCVSDDSAVGSTTRCDLINSGGFSFAGNPFASSADLFGQFSLSTNIGDAAANGWLGRISDPVEGRAIREPASAIPEPASIVLLVTGLVGMAGLRRSRQKKA